MAETSVAPKERVNITYRPATGDAQEEVELPLKLVMMGDYTLQPDDTPVEDRRKINIDKDNFNSVMQNHHLQLDLSVPNRLSDEADAGDMQAQLQFKTLRDFAPEAVVRKVPELNALLELRQALSALRGPLGNIRDFRQRIEEILKSDADKERLLKELKVNGTTS